MKIEEEGPAGAYRRRMRRAALMMTAGAVAMGIGMAAAGAANIMDGNVTGGAAAAVFGLAAAAGAPFALGTAGRYSLGEAIRRRRRRNTGTGTGRWSQRPGPTPAARETGGPGRQNPGQE